MNRVLNRLSPFWRVIPGLLVGLLLLVSLSAGAKTIMVTNPDDSGDHSLRWAIDQADDGDVVEIAAELAGIPIVLSAPIRIMQPSQTTRTVHAGGEQAAAMTNYTLYLKFPYRHRARQSRMLAGSNVLLPTAIDIRGSAVISGGKRTHLFEMGPGVTVNIEGLTLTEGNNVAGAGGAVDNAGTVTLSNCWLKDNVAKKEGGALQNQRGALLTVDDSTLSGNTAELNGGGIANAGTLTLRRSTLFNNQAEEGGGLYTEGTATAAHLTASQNRANSYGGGVVVKTAAGSLQLSNSLVVGNTAKSVDGQEIYNIGGSYTGLGMNLVGQNGQASVYPGSLVDDVKTLPNPKARDQTLHPLAPTSGAYPVATLPRTSSAINVGDNRIAQNNGVTPADGQADIGAVQYEDYHQLTVTRTGEGTVSSAPALLDCGTAVCVGNFPGDATVRLSATPGLTGWGGACAGTAVTAVCEVLMDDDQEATATFGGGGGSTTGSAVGVFRAGTWFLDANANGGWEGCQQEGGQDLCLFNAFGSVGDLPAAGDWNGDGQSKVGVFRAGTWYLDYNGNGAWDGCGIDRCYAGSFGAEGDWPAAGDWNGDGKAKVGVFRAGTWYLDYNGNGAWDGCSVDRCYAGSFGQTGDLPAAGDWNGDGKAKVGVFRAGTWYLDYNGNGAWDGCSVDRCYAGSFGQAGDLPAAGDWNDDGKAKVGVFRAGTWYLDYNGNGAWDGCGIDRCYEGSFGGQGDLPVAGRWGLNASPVYYALTVNATGTGSGTVSGGGGYGAGAVVTLTANPASGSTFTGWSPSPCAASFAMPANPLTCTATFTLNPPNTYSLNVSKTGTGSGTITSSPPGINCGSDCTENYASGTLVTLTASAVSGSTFTGWSGDCSGTATTCTVTMSGATNVTAAFAQASGTTPEIVTILGGTFLMGSPTSEVGREGDEQQHSVTVASFAMGKYEVTFDEYDRFVEATGHAKPDDEGWGRERRPVINVDWNDAVAYAQWLSQQTGLAYRLPTEAEWEYAARAGTRTPFWTGNCVTTAQANYDGNYGYGDPDCGANTGLYREQTLAVGAFPANPWGLYDTMGNVWEWTCSLYQDPYGGDEQKCNLNYTTSAWVVRGGAWNNQPAGVRSAYRGRLGPSTRSNWLGFRLVRSL